MIAPVALSVSLSELQGLRSAARQVHLGRLLQKNRPAAVGRTGSQVGRGLEFREVRSYQPGDDPRYLDWKVTARKGQPYTRVFHEEHQRPVMLFVDLASQLQFGQAGSKAVLSAKLAGVLGWAALHDKDQMGGWIETDEQSFWQPPLSTTTAFSPFLARLAACTQALGDLKPRPAGRLDAALDAFARRLPRDSLVVLISDFVGFSQPRLLQQLASRFPLQVLHLTDPLDQQLPDRGGPVLMGGQKIPLNQALRDSWAAAFIERSKQLQAALGYRGSYRQLSTTTAQDWLKALTH